MAPTLSEDEIDDLVYFARAGETADLNETLIALAARESVSSAEILATAKDAGKSTCLHMATGNGNLGSFFFPRCVFSLLKSQEYVLACADISSCRNRQDFG